MNIKSIHDPISKPIAVCIIAGTFCLAVLLLWHFAYLRSLSEQVVPLGHPTTPAKRAELVRMMSATSTKHSLTAEQKKAIELMKATQPARKPTQAERQRIIDSLEGMMKADSL